MTIEGAYRALHMRDRPVYLDEHADAETLLWRIFDEGYGADL